MAAEGPQAPAKPHHAPCGAHCKQAAEKLAPSVNTFAAEDGESQVLVAQTDATARVGVIVTNLAPETAICRAQKKSPRRHNFFSR